MTSSTTALVAAALLGATGVGLGALGAHALQEKLTEPLLASFKTGVLYQLIHALALLALAAVAASRPTLDLRWSIGLWILGTFLFSGSIYLLSLRGLLGIEHWRWLAPLTPLGGLMLIAGWVTLSIAAFRN